MLILKAGLKRTEQLVASIFFVNVISWQYAGDAQRILGRKIWQVVELLKFSLESLLRNTSLGIHSEQSLQNYYNFLFGQKFP